MNLYQDIRSRIEENMVGGRTEFIIYPFGEIGLFVKQILNEQFGIKEAYVVDEKLSKYNREVLDLGGLSRMDISKYKVFLSSTNKNIYSTLKTNLLLITDETNIIELDCMRIIEAESKVGKTEVGRYSYGPLCSGSMYIQSIGSFCSFATGSAVVGNHDMDIITTHPVCEQTVICRALYNSKPYYFDGVEPPSERKTALKQTVIGNDVWLGLNTIIIAGNHIGNGVIAGAGSVITKDVPDYAVVAGNPAKINRYRYSPEQIMALNRIKWWDWTDDEIRKRYEDLFLPIDVFIKKYDDQGQENQILKEPLWRT